MPVRSVISIDNTRDLGGAAPGDAVWQVADFSVQSLPDTPANAALLAMSTHTGAPMVNETRQQYVKHGRVAAWAAERHGHHATRQAQLTQRELGPGCASAPGSARRGDVKSGAR
jgi:hypothetical protein